MVVWIGTCRRVPIVMPGHGWHWSTLYIVSVIIQSKLKRSSSTIYNQYSSCNHRYKWLMFRFDNSFFHGIFCTLVNLVIQTIWNLFRTISTSASGNLLEVQFSKPELSYILLRHTARFVKLTFFLNCAIGEKHWMRCLASLIDYASILRSRLLVETKEVTCAEKMLKKKSSCGVIVRKR